LFCLQQTVKVWEDPRTNRREILCPARFTPKAVKRLKEGLGSEYRIAGQLNQRPSPQEGDYLNVHGSHGGKNLNPQSYYKSFNPGIRA